jgi:hypothetical protein
MMKRLLSRRPTPRTGLATKPQQRRGSRRPCEAESLERRVLLSGAVAQILVVNGTTVGEYNSNGATVNASLIAGLSQTYGIAVSGANIFLPELNSGLAGNGTVEEYSTSGEIVNGSLITGLAAPEGIVVSGNDLFVSDELTGSIGEYTTAGATVNQDIVTGLPTVSSVQPLSIAVSGNDIFVLTTAYNNQNQIIGTIQEYTTTGLIVNQSVVTGIPDAEPQGIAVSGNDLFVVNRAANLLAEYTTSGQLVNGALLSGLDSPIGISIFGSDIFVMNSASDSIGEYTTSGATVNANLITGVFNGTWLATETAAGAPAQVAVTLQPDLAVAGQTIAPITVAIEDASGNVETTDDANVSLSILSGPSGGVLEGTTTVAAVNGLADFTNLKFTRGGEYTLEATSTGLAAATSTPINAIVGWIDEADLNQIVGWAYNPSNPSVSVAIEVQILNGPTQVFTANQNRQDVEPVTGNAAVGFDYATPMISTGSHLVNIFAEEPGVGNVLIGSTTLVSQNGLFDTHYYLQNNPQVLTDVQDGFYATAYDQYIAVGQFDEAIYGEPDPYWNESYYLAMNPDVQLAVNHGTISSGFMHYYLYGQFENRPGLVYVDPTFYLSTYSDVANAINPNGPVTSAFEHFCDFGQYEGRDPDPYFDTAYYEANNEDIPPYISGEPYSSAFEQFVEAGILPSEDRTWSMNFNEQTYFNDNMWLAPFIGPGPNQFISGFVHWLEYGQYEMLPGG